MTTKAIFLDRDGTLIEDTGYLNDPGQMKILPGVPDALVELKQLGYKLIVVTNQSAVARGIVSEKVLGQIHERLKELLVQDGAQVDRIYYCPYHPDGVIEKYRKESDLRKPNPGMLTTAAKEMDIDLSQSWMIGDAYSDVTAGSRAGCKTILINPPLNYKHPKPGDAASDYKAVNLREAVNIIKRQDRFPNETHNQTEVRSDMQATSTAEQTQTNTNEQMQQKPVEADSIDSDSSEQLLREILRQIKGMQRVDMFREFSAMKLIAGVLQIIVLFCLLVSVWLLMGPDVPSVRVLVALGFAAVFQLMSLTLYIMHWWK